MCRCVVWAAAGGGVECVAVTRGEGRSEGAMGKLLVRVEVCGWVGGGAVHMARPVDGFTACC